MDREAGPRPDSFQELVAQPALFLVAAAAGVGDAAAARPPGRGRAGARRAGAPARGRGGAGAARARHARLARQDGVGDRLRGARAVAPDRARSRGRGAGGAPARGGRPPGDAPGARDHRRAAHGQRRAAAALGVGRRARAPLGRGDRASTLDLAVEDVGELHPATGRELEWIVQEALANVARHARATRVAVRMRRLGGRAVLTVTDDGAGFEVPDELDELGRRAALRRRRHARARAARRRRPQRRVGARRGLRAVGLGPDRDRAARGRACRGSTAPADADGNVPGRSVPGYTWQ